MPPRTPIGPLIIEIIEVRSQRVILAADLATIYDVEPRVLNHPIKRNPDRFPADFALRLTAEEFEGLKARGIVSGDGRAALRSQSVILKRGQHAKYPPYAFTEHGALMAATVLNSASAIAICVYVVRAFLQMRERLNVNAVLLARLAEIDGRLFEHDQVLQRIWTKLQPLIEIPPEAPRRRIGFPPRGSALRTARTRAPG